MGNNVSYAESEPEPEKEVAEAEDVEEEEEESAAEPEEEEEPAKTFKLETARFDPRFPNTNQARHCYTRYNEFHKCNAEGGDDCEKYAKAYRSLCPTAWVNKWNEQREEGTWA